MTKNITDKKHSGNNLRTICEVHREIYDIIYDSENEHLKELVNEAYVLAKKMDAKLRQYKNNYDDDWWQKERKEVVKEKIQRRSNR